MRLETGWQVFFYPKRNNIVGKAIVFGEKLGAWLRGKPYTGPVPHHVETVRRTLDGVMLYGADANAGFVPKPVVKRLAGLKPGRDYKVVALATSGGRDIIAEALVKMAGTPYQDWNEVLSVWRDGVRDKGADEVFCSEGSVRALSQWFEWASELDPDNTDPAEWDTVCGLNGGRDVTPLCVKGIR